MADLTLPVDGGYLSIRVGAIIQKKDKFLVVYDDNLEYGWSVGGRVHYGETIEEAVIREVQEETGVRLEIDRLAFVHENFFIADWQAKMGKKMHEYSFYFYMKTPEDFEPISTDFDEDGEEQKLVWLTVGDDSKYHPEFFKTELKNPSNEIKHIITKEW